MNEPVLNPANMIKRVAGALASHNLDELMSFYEPAAVLVRPDGSEAQGIEKIREEYAGYINRVIAMEADVIWTHVPGDIASVRGRFSITFERRDGSTVTRSGEPIEVLRQQPDGSWLYLIDHGSGADVRDHADI